MTPGELEQARREWEAEIRAGRSEMARNLKAEWEAELRRREAGGRSGISRRWFWTIIGFCTVAIVASIIAMVVS